MKNFVMLLIALTFSIQAHSATTEGNRVLNQAIYLNDVAAVKQTLQLKVDINAPSFNGIYAIHAAASLGVKDEILSIILANGANTGVQDKYGQTALHIAVRGNSLSKIKLLLAAKADPNIATQLGDSALHLAVTSHDANSEEMTALILKSENIRVDQRNRGGYTALMLVVLRFNPTPKTVSNLLETGADKNLTNLGHYSALDFAQGMLNFFRSKSTEDTQQTSDLANIVEMLKRH